MYTFCDPPKITLRTFRLRTNLSQSVHRGNVIFKGGTSLSKAYSLIERFSEDIDLAVLSPGEYTDAKMKALLKQIATDITPVLR